MRARGNLCFLRDFILEFVDFVRFPLAVITVPLKYFKFHVFDNLTYFYGVSADSEIYRKSSF